MTKTIARAATITAAITAAAVGLTLAAPGNRPPRPVAVASAAFHAPLPARQAPATAPAPAVTAPAAPAAAQRPARPGAVHATNAGPPPAARAAAAASTPVPSTPSAAADPPVLVQYSNGSCGQTGAAEAEANHLTIVTACTPPTAAPSTTGTGPTGEPVAADPQVTVVYPDGTCGETGQEEATTTGLKIVPTSACPHPAIILKPAGPFEMTPAARIVFAEAAAAAPRP